MKQGSKTLDLTFAFVAFLLLLFVGAIAGFKIGSHFVDLQSSGVFASWKLLDGPYKFKEIVDANSSMVWVKAIDGKIYSWDCQYHECRWIEVENVPADAHENYQGMGEQPLNKGDTCPADESFAPSEEPPGKIVECALGWYRATDAGFGSYFVLLEDGTIWSWQHTSDVINASMTIIPLSVLDGLLVGSAIFFIIILIMKRYSNINKIVGSLVVLILTWLISCNLFIFIHDYRILFITIFIINAGCFIWFFYQFLMWKIQKRLPKNT